jgi:hypothetical protein
MQDGNETRHSLTSVVVAWEQMDACVVPQAENGGPDNFASKSKRVALVEAINAATNADVDTKWVKKKLKKM